MAHSRDRRLRERRANLARLCTWANATRTLGALGFVYVLTIYEGEDTQALAALCVSLILSPHFIRRDDK